MTEEQFRAVFRKRPFHTLVIHTASREAYTVSHPESIWQDPKGSTVILSAQDAGVVLLDATLVSDGRVPGAQ
jgi:hypothetical protein